MNKYVWPNQEHYSPTRNLCLTYLYISSKARRRYGALYPYRKRAEALRRKNTACLVHDKDQRMCVSVAAT